LCKEAHKRLSVIVSGEVFSIIMFEISYVIRYGL
jgi:hypothetical protein